MILIEREKDEPVTRQNEKELPTERETKQG